MEPDMASLTIRNLEDALKASLRVRAAHHGRSMEEEARQILRGALVREEAAIGLGSRIASRFSAAGGVELPKVPRSQPRPSPGFGAEER
jgi:plasmid stability protein